MRGNRLVNDLRDEIIEELSGEDVGVQVRVAFSVLVAVMNEGAKREPAELRATLTELRELLTMVQ